MKPLIGITTGEIINQAEPWSAMVYGQKQTYSDAIIAAGGIPVFIPFMPETELRELYEKLDGVLFAGGNDINPQLYGEEQRPVTVDVSLERDRIEATLMEWTLNDDKPLFAICRGFQLLNAHLGGSLYQDLLTEREGSSNHQLSTHKKDYTHIAHQLKVAPESQLAAITGVQTLAANTHHHQGIEELASELQASAWAEDSLVEAAENPKKVFTIGVQCHPESLYTFDNAWAKIFQKFVATSASSK